MSVPPPPPKPAPAPEPVEEKAAAKAAPKPRTNRLQFLEGLGDVVQESPTQHLAAPSNTRAADLNFKVSEEFHRAFKAAATIKGISMKELLDEAFQLWVERNQMAHMTADVSAGVVQQRSRGRIERSRRKRA